jgi:hypothetical protein
MVLRNLTSAPRHCAMPRGPEYQGIIGQAQHPRGSPPALLTRFGPLRLLPLPQAEEHPEHPRFQDVAEIQLNTTRQLQAIPKQAYQTALKSGRFAGIAAYNLEGRTLKEITSSNL